MGGYHEPIKTKVNLNEQICTECGQKKHLGEFDLDEFCTGGHRPECSECGQALIFEREVNKYRGDISEHLAAAWLMENGYEVFPNAANHGPIDIVAIKNEEVILIDVKTATRTVRINGSVRIKCGSQLSQVQKARGVKLLFVTHAGQISFNPEELNMKEVVNDSSKM